MKFGVLGELLIGLVQFSVESDHLLLPRAAGRQRWVVVMVKIEQQRVFLVLRLGDSFSTDVSLEITVALLLLLSSFEV